MDDGGEVRLCRTPGCTLPYGHSEPCALGRAKRERSQPDYTGGHEAIELHLRACKAARREEEAAEKAAAAAMKVGEEVHAVVEVVEEEEEEAMEVDETAAAVPPPPPAKHRSDLNDSSSDEEWDIEEPWEDF